LGRPNFAIPPAAPAAPAEAPLGRPNFAIPAAAPATPAGAPLGRPNFAPVAAAAPGGAAAATDLTEPTGPTGPGSLTRHERQERQRRRRAAGIVGVVGELLITVGVLLGLYVVWELVWTDVEANQQAGDVLLALRDRPDWVTPDGAGDFARLRDPALEPPPVDESPLATPAFGESWASLHVPRWGLDYNVPIVEGTDRVKILNKGLVGHYEGTEGPGRVGNFATSAHRTTYGKPYNRVAELEVGDSLIVETAQYYFVYKMYETDIVYPGDVQVIDPVPRRADDTPTKPDGQPYDSEEATKRIMTLTTCHPMFSARQRFVVWGELAYWADKADGPLEELAGG
jgi:sortase A